MMEIKRHTSGSPWEEKVSYCRALKVKDRVFVSGTAPIDEDGKTVSPGDGYLQAKRCFEIIEKSLAEFDVPMSQVVRTRMFVTDISKWESYGRAHHEFFKGHSPVTSMIEVKGLIDKDMLIEIEAEAEAVV